MNAKINQITITLTAKEAKRLIFDIDGLREQANTSGLPDELQNRLISAIQGENN